MANKEQFEYNRKSKKELKELAKRLNKYFYKETKGEKFTLINNKLYKTE